MNGGQGRGRRAHARCPAVLRQRGACDVVCSARGAAAVSTPDWVGVVCGLWLVAGASGLVCQAGHPLPPRLLAVWATRLWQDDVRDGTGWCSQAQHLCSHAGEQAVRVWGAACLGIGWVGLGCACVQCMGTAHADVAVTTAPDCRTKACVECFNQRRCGCVALLCAVPQAVRCLPLLCVAVLLCLCVCVAVCVCGCMWLCASS